MIGERLRAARQSRRYTQEQLESLSDVSIQNINRYENNKTSIKDAELAKLAKALNVSADFLLGLTDDPTPQKLKTKLSQLETDVLAAVRDGKYVDAIDALVERMKSTA